MRPNKVSKKVFRGGPVFLNSGGQGPDDWLIKPIEGGRWTLVVFRWGRNWAGRQVGLGKAAEFAKSDKVAMIAMYAVGIDRVCVGDLARRFQQMKKRGVVPKMCATEFWQKYQDKGGAK